MMIPLLQKELNAFFSSLMAYVIIGFFLIVMGLWMWLLPETNVIDSGYADMQPFFRFSPYIFMFLVPAITMRSFAEEKKMGTLEVLLTTPLTPTQIILGKFLASLLILLVTLLLTSSYYGSIYALGNPPGNIDTAAVIGAYIGLLLIAAVFITIGLFASALTESQVIAFLCSVLLCFLLYQAFDAWMLLQTWKSYALFVAQLGIVYHYEALSRGVVDSRDLLYFISMATLFLFLTRIVLSYKR